MSSFLDHIVGSFSTGAIENPTVVMMDAAFTDMGLPWRYVNCEVSPSELEPAVAGAASMGWDGFNCSMPHKQSVIALIGRLSDTAGICQAVNCVTKSELGWVGHNTDGAGFLTSVQDVETVRGIEVMVIGSGGAAHAIAVELGFAGAKLVHIVSRDTDRAGSLAKLVTSSSAAAASIGPWSDAISIPPTVRLVVNATPVGSAPHESSVVPVDWSTAKPDLLAADVVIRPAYTRFLRLARAAGATTIDGTGMLVNQAAENIRLWTGQRPSPAPMRAALDRALLNATS